MSGPLERRRCGGRPWAKGDGDEAVESLAVALTL
jgi:hypothetical protein